MSLRLNSGLPVCREKPEQSASLLWGRSGGMVKHPMTLKEPTDLRCDLNPFVGFNMCNYLENIGKPKPQGRLPSPAPCLRDSALELLMLSPLGFSTSAGDPCGFMHPNFYTGFSSGGKASKVFVGFFLWLSLTTCFPSSVQCCQLEMQS